MIVITIFDPRGGSNSTGGWGGWTPPVMKKSSEWRVDPPGLSWTIQALMAVIMTQKRCTLNQHRSATSIKNIMLWIEDKLYIGLQGRRKWGGCKGHYCRMLTEAKYWSFVSHNSPHGPNFRLRKERWSKFEVIISLAIILSLDESLGHAGNYGK